MSREDYGRLVEQLVCTQPPVVGIIYTAETSFSGQASSAASADLLEQTDRLLLDFLQLFNAVSDAGLGPFELCVMTRDRFRTESTPLVAPDFAVLQAILGSRVRRILKRPFAGFI